MGILNKHTNSQVSINNQTSQSPNGITSSPVSFLAGRVKSIILDENSEGFNEFGEGNPGWNGLGLIQFQDITNPTTKISSETKASDRRIDFMVLLILLLA